MAAYREELEILRIIGTKWLIPRDGRDLNVAHISHAPISDVVILLFLEDPARTAQPGWGISFSKEPRNASNSSGSDCILRQ